MPWPHYLPRVRHLMSLLNTYVFMTKVLKSAGLAGWTAPETGLRRRRCARARATSCLLPDLRFAIERNEEALLFTPSILGSSKNASFDPVTGRAGRHDSGGSGRWSALQSLHAPLQRIGRRRWSPRSAAGVRQIGWSRGASFRPAEIAGAPDDAGGRTTRGCTWTAFRRRRPGGRRILRVFSEREPRGPRAIVAARRRLRRGRVAASRRSCGMPLPGSRALLRAGCASRRRTRSRLRRADAAAARSDEGGRGVSDATRRRAASTSRRDRRGWRSPDQSEPRGDARAVSARADVPAACGRDERAVSARLFACSSASNSEH